MTASRITVTAVVVAAFVLSLVAYPRMPEQMASHWNGAGEVDGYMPRFWGLFFIPVVLVGLVLLLMLAPLIDPLRTNIEGFRATYEWFVAITVAFFFYVHLLTILWSLGVQFEMLSALAPAFGLLLFAAGALVEKAKRNWFIGIRTPWTLSSERVWEQTHRLGSKLFKLAGVLAVAGLAFPRYALVFVLGPVLAASLCATVYSYLAYRSEMQSSA